MLAATERLASSAINATCSPGRTLRHISTALRAPGIKSACGEPNFISLILLELQGFSSAVHQQVFFLQLAIRLVESLPRWTRALSARIQAKRLPDQLDGELRRDTRNAGTCPPPLVTLARPVALRRVRKPQSFPRNKYGAKSTSMSRKSTFPTSAM